MTQLDTTKFERVAQYIAPESRLLRAWALTGGVSAQVTALELLLPDGQRKRLVVRRHGQVDRQQNPQIAADEFRLLQVLQAAGVAAPAPYHLDQTETIFATPYLVIEYVEGETVFAPVDLDDYLLQTVTQLVKIHQVNPVARDLSFLPTHAPNLVARSAQLDETTDGARIDAILKAVWPLPARNQPVLLHGDFWPGNILWQHGKLAAVIDWEDAQIGDPLADLANSRLEFLWAFGDEAQQKFTQLYQAMTHIDLTHLPYYDLYAAWRNIPKIATWGLDAKHEEKLRQRLSAFIAQAIAPSSAR